MPGRYLSLVPNHPLTMGGSLASANATVINIRRQMVAAWSFRLRCPSCSTGGRTDVNTDALTLRPEETALVLVDLQRGVAGAATAPHPAEEVVSRAARLLAACRARGVLPVLVHVDPGPGWSLFPRPPCDQPRPVTPLPRDWSDFMPPLAPQPSDVMITKHQPNAFFGTDLEIHLRRRGVRTLLLGGIATNVGVEATARAAHERGYVQVFVEDVMAAREADLHEHSVRRIFPTLGYVRSIDAVLAALGAG